MPMPLGASGEGGVCVAVHVPAVWTEKAVTLERGNVAVLILLAQHCGSARQLRGGGSLRAEPAAVCPDRSGPRGSALARRVTSAEKGPDGGADIAFKCGAGVGKVLTIEQLVIPLCRGKPILRID